MNAERIAQSEATNRDDRQHQTPLIGSGRQRHAAVTTANNKQAN